MLKHILIIAILLASTVYYSHAQTLTQVKDINPSGNSFPRSLTVCNGKLFFMASDASGYQKLFVTDGTEAGTIVLQNEINTAIQSLVAYKDKIYFDCNDPVNGQELWVSDGTVAGTKLFKDIMPGTAGSYPTYFTIANGKLFFAAINFAGQKLMYVTDGTSAGTVVVKEFVDIFNGNTSFGVMNNSIYFRSDDGTGSGYGLWRSDGTSAGTALVYSSTNNGFVPGNLGCNTVVLNNKLYLNASDNTYGGELWVTDGTTAGTHVVKNLKADGGGIYGNGGPAFMIIFNSKIYFMGSDDTHGVELFVSDGTDPGTTLVKDIVPGTDGSTPYSMIPYNGKLYLSCWAIQQLWQTDGTTAGTTLVTGNIMQYGRFTAVWNNKMYLTGLIDNNVIESDGTAAGTKPAFADNVTSPITTYSADQQFTVYNASLYFSASSAGVTNGFELSKLSSAAAVTSYTFTGSGNWSNPANWAGGLVPPSILPSGYTVTITGNCTLDVSVQAQPGSSIIVATGGSLLIIGSLTLV